MGDRYNGMNMNSKVRTFLASTKDQWLSSCITQVLADPELLDSFDKSVICQHGSMGRVTNISRLRTDGADGGDDCDGNEVSDNNGDSDLVKEYDNEPDMSVENCYYEPDEYENLPRAKKLGSKIKRKASNLRHGRKMKQGRKAANAEDITKLDKGTIKALAIAVTEPVAEHMRNQAPP